MEGVRENQIGLQGKGGAIGLEEMAEKKEDAVKELEGEMVQILESLLGVEG